jgi:hypothetical protein
MRLHHASARHGLGSLLVSLAVLAQAPQPVTRVPPMQGGTVQQRPEGARYPASRHGGNYMFNYYFPPYAASTPWAPDWSPDGKWIAVARR